MRNNASLPQPRKRPREIVSKNMSKIRSSDTEIERMVRSSLWKLGYRYRKNYSKLPGKPDIVFVRERVAVFCDSDFWHGRDWSTLKKRLRTNPEYWIPKIERNRNRDKKVSQELALMDWTVIRLWESDIKKDLDSCVQRIAGLVDVKREEIGNV